MIWSIAWKNIWRNKLRSSVVMVAVMIGILAGSFTIALMTGMTESRTKSLINNESSHIQIHHPEFGANQEPEFQINKANQLSAEIRKLPEVQAVCKRIKINAMASSSAGANTAAFVFGIDPEIEKTVTEIHEHINDSSGNYFDTDFQNPILIGEEFAKTLKFDRYKFEASSYKYLEARDIPDKIISQLKTLEGKRYRRFTQFKDSVINLIGEKEFEAHEYFLKKATIYFKENGKVALTIMPDSGAQTQAIFRVCGIYKTDNSLFDGMHVFVRATDLQRLSGYSLNSPHEMALLLTNNDMTEAVSEKLQKAYPNLNVSTWKENNPEVAMLSDYIDFYNYLIVGLILAALAFGIVNTMLMAIMERTKELGMLAAIGMNKKRRFSMIMTETIFLTITGAIVGMGVNILLMSWLGKTGIDLSGQIGVGMEAMGYSAVMYPVMYTKYYIGITVMVIFTAILSSIYPAVKALRLNPANAIRSDA